MEVGLKKAEELIKRDFINFYWASKGVAGVKIKPVSNLAGEIRYRFKTYYCDDGL